MYSRQINHEKLLIPVEQFTHPHSDRHPNLHNFFVGPIFIICASPFNEVRLTFSPLNNFFVFFFASLQWTIKLIHTTPWSPIIIYHRFIFLSSSASCSTFRRSPGPSAGFTTSGGHWGWRHILFTHWFNWWSVFTAGWLRPIEIQLERHNLVETLPDLHQAQCTIRCQSSDKENNSMRPLMTSSCAYWEWAGYIS